MNEKETNMKYKNKQSIHRHEQLWKSTNEENL